MSEGEEQRGPREPRTYGTPARRRRIVELLTEAYARDDLDESEFERRVELAEKARTIEELDSLVADFPPDVVASLEAGEQAPASTGHRVPDTPRGATPLSGGELQREIARLESVAAPTRFSVIGDLKVLVRREDERLVRSVSLLGDCTVDLRDLAGEGGVVVVNSVSLFGDTRVLVSPGTPVEVRLFGLIGDQERKRGGGLLKRLGRKLGISEGTEDRPSSLPGPTVVVTGFRLIGDTVIVEE